MSGSITTKLYARLSNHHKATQLFSGQGASFAGCPRPGLMGMVVSGGKNDSMGSMQVIRY